MLICLQLKIQYNSNRLAKCGKHCVRARTSETMTVFQPRPLIKIFLYEGKFFHASSVAQHCCINTQEPVVRTAAMTENHYWCFSFPSHLPCLWWYCLCFRDPSHARLCSGRSYLCLEMKPLKNSECVAGRHRNDENANLFKQMGRVLILVSETDKMFFIIKFPIEFVCISTPNVFCSPSVWSCCTSDWGFIAYCIYNLQDVSSSVDFLPNFVLPITQLFGYVLPFSFLLLQNIFCNKMFYPCCLPTFSFNLNKMSPV